MGIDWKQLSIDIGSDTSFGTSVAERALELILGDDNLARAVEIILAEEPGWNVAHSVLVHIVSERAMQIAYSMYKTSSGDRAVRAARLVKDLHHPDSIAWIQEFLADPNLGSLGIDLLDQLIFSHRVDGSDAMVKNILKQADQHELATVREGAAEIRTYLDQSCEDANS